MTVRGTDFFVHKSGQPDMRRKGKGALALLITVTTMAS